MFRIVFSLNEHENIQILILGFLGKVRLESSQEILRFLIPSVSSWVRYNRRIEFLLSLPVPAGKRLPKFKIME